MKRRLFLTGPIGCGKSTAIEQALGNRLTRCGGFRTRRLPGPDGHPISFYLESPDGSERATFLDFSSGKPEIHMEVFAQLGVSLLDGKILVLDEIGGIELLCPEFMTALDSLIKSSIPVLGVMKGEGPAGSLVRALGLTREYEAAVSNLRKYLNQDKDSLLYECGQFDKTALLLARQWVEEYANE